MKLKAALKLMFRCFCVITTSMTLFIPLLNMAVGVEFSLNETEMLRIPLISAASTLPVLISVHGEKASRREVTLRGILQFVLTGTIVFVMLLIYGWIDASNAIATGIMFVLLYAGIYFTLELRAKKLADKLNERINAFHDTENAAHPKDR